LIGDLGKTRLSTAIVPLRDAGSDPDPDVRAAVATALGMLGDSAARDDSVRDLISKLAADETVDVRVEAVRAALPLGCTKTITAALNDSDSNVVAAALSVAGPNQAALLGPRILGSDESLRILAIDAVARGRIVADAPAVAAQTNSDIATKVAAVRALGVLSTAQCADDVLKLLTDANPTVRREATIALTCVGAAEARRNAIRMLGDEDETVRTAAAGVLVRVPGPEAVAPLVAKLSDPYGPLHESARAALVAAGGSTIPYAVQLLNDPDSRRREDGSYLLGKLRSRSGFQKQLELLDDTDWSVAGQAANSLGTISDPVAAPRLVHMLDRAVKALAGSKSATMPVAIAATNAIVSAARLGYAPIVDKVSPYIFTQTNLPSNVRASAVWAVGFLGATNESAIFDQFPALVGDPFEAADVKLEVLKAVGNRKSIKGEAIFSQHSEILRSNEALAIIHWSTDRINGHVTSFSLPPQVYVADTSVTAIQSGGNLGG
jgi:HEAT repeat protein